MCRMEGGVEIGRIRGIRGWLGMDGKGCREGLQNSQAFPNEQKLTQMAKLRLIQMFRKSWQQSYAYQNTPIQS